MPSLSEIETGSSSYKELVRDSGLKQCLLQRLVDLRVHEYNKLAKLLKTVKDKAEVEGKPGQEIDYRALALTLVKEGSVYAGTGAGADVDADADAVLELKDESDDYEYIKSEDESQSEPPPESKPPKQFSFTRLYLPDVTRLVDKMKLDDIKNESQLLHYFFFKGLPLCAFEANYEKFMKSLKMKKKVKSEKQLTSLVQLMSYNKIWLDHVSIRDVHNILVVRSKLEAFESDFLFTWRAALMAGRTTDSTAALVDSLKKLSIRCVPVAPAVATTAAAATVDPPVPERSKVRKAPLSSDFNQGRIRIEFEDGTSQLVPLSQLKL